jgi:hypothetical protein
VAKKYLGEWYQVFACSITGLAPLENLLLFLQLGNVTFSRIHTATSRQKAVYF